jgi:uncharacterized protein (TIGR03083 family)
VIDPHDLHRQLVAAAAELRGVIATGDLTATVPACPGWDLAALAAHVPVAFRFATVGIVEKSPNGWQEDVVASDRSALLRWWDDGWRGLQDALTTHPWDADCWTMGEPRNVSFWVRRQCHEVTVHLWDAQSALGEAQSIPSAIALDGIDEALTMFLPRQIKRERIAPLSERIELRTDSGETFTFGGEDGAAPVATVDGPAASLVLLLYKRISPRDASVRISGDVAAAERVLAQALTP